MLNVRTWMVMIAGGQLLLVSGQSFNRRYDTFSQGHSQAAWSIDRTSDGDVAITVGTPFADSLFLYQTVAIQYVDDMGTLLSENMMLYGANSIYPGFVNCSERTVDGGLIVGGSTYPPSEISNAALLLYTSDGDSLWLREYGDTVSDWLGRKAIQTKDGGYLLCGETNSIGVVDAFLMKTDANGEETWRRTYGGPSFRDYFATMDTTNDDGYFIGGEYRLVEDDLDLWVLRLNSEGDTLWSKVWGSGYDEPNAHLTTLSNGDPIVASSWGFAPEFNLTRAYMAELDQYDGHIIWENMYGPMEGQATLYTPKEVRPGEGCIAAGYTYHDNTLFFQGTMLRTATNGDSIWMRNYFYYDSLMTDGRGLFRDVIPTSDGGFMACGMAANAFAGYNPPGLSADVWVVKVDSLGCIIPGCDIPMGITSQITNLGSALNVYPNPVRDQLHVGIKLPANFKIEGPLALTVVSMEGKLVRQESVPTSAVDEVVLDVTGLSPGAYTVHLSDADTWIAGKKFVVE